MIQAVIFDLDGTVLDNEQQWGQAFAEVARNNGLSIEQHEPGIGVLANWKKLVGDLELAQKLTIQTKRLYGSMDASVRNGFENVIAYIKENQYKTALASSSDWNAVEPQLEELDLVLAFDITTTGEEVLALKPDPEIYLLTCQKLGFEPEECLVVEDSLAGVESAKDAGCKVVGIANEIFNKVSLKAARADFVVDSLEEIVLILREDGNQTNKNSNIKDQN